MSEAPWLIAPDESEPLMPSKSPGPYSLPGGRDIRLGVRRGDIEPGAAYFAIAGSSTHFDPTNTEVKLYDLSGAHIADSANPVTAVALLEEILRASVFLPKQRPRIEAALTKALAGDPLIDHLFADELPLKQAGNHLGYGGVLVWEGVDIDGPSSAFVWQTGHVRELTPEEVQAVLVVHATKNCGPQEAGELQCDRTQTQRPAA